MTNTNGWFKNRTLDPSDCPSALTNKAIEKKHVHLGEHHLYMGEICEYVFNSCPVYIVRCFLLIKNGRIWICIPDSVWQIAMGTTQAQVRYSKVAYIYIYVYTRSHADGINTPPAKMAYFCSIFSGASINAICWCAASFKNWIRKPTSIKMGCQLSVCARFFSQKDRNAVRPETIIYIYTYNPGRILRI